MSHRTAVFEGQRPRRRRGHDAPGAVADQVGPGRQCARLQEGCRQGAALSHGAIAVGARIEADERGRVPVPAEDIEPRPDAPHQCPGHLFRHREVKRPRQRVEPVNEHHRRPPHDRRIARPSHVREVDQDPPRRVSSEREERWPLVAPDHRRRCRQYQDPRGHQYTQSGASTLPEHLLNARPSSVLVAHSSLPRSTRRGIDEILYFSTRSASGSGILVWTAPAGCSIMKVLPAAACPSPKERTERE